MKIPSLLDKSFSAVLNAVLNLLTKELEFTLRARLTARVIASATPDALNDIAHDLGAVPDGYIVVEKNSAVDEIYNTAADREFWTATNIRVRSNTASTSFRLAVIKQE